MSINQGQEELTKFCRMFAEFSRNRTGPTPAHKLLLRSRGRSEPTIPVELWFTETEDSESDDEYRVMPPLIYPEDYDEEEDDPHESPNYLTFTGTTPEPEPPGKKPTNEPTFEDNSDSLSGPSAPTKEFYMGNLSPREIVIYQKGSYPPRFVTLEELTKEDLWGDTCKIRILGQYKSLEAVEDLLNPTKSPSPIPTNLEDVDKDVLGDDLTKEDMEELWSTKDLLGRDEREILFWHHRLNHCSFNTS